MLIQATAPVFSKAPRAGVNLQQVWHFDESELSPNATAVLQEFCTNESLNEVATRAAWFSLAVLEFQDTLSLVLPEEGQFLHRNYLFHEALAALRESALTGLNGSYHSSFAVLRSALELFISHYWWRNRLRVQDSCEEFYRWLSGEDNRRSDRFSSFITETYSAVSMPSAARDQAATRAVYSKLCSYSHKPILAEATTKLKGGNEPKASDRAIRYWLELLTETLECLLDFAVANHPQAVFPVNVYRKFGFNVPIAALLDQYSFVPIAAALGDSAVAEYQRHYRKQATAVLQWYEEQTDLGDDEIMSSWTDEVSFDDDEEAFEAKLVRRVSASKAHIRAMLLLFSYAAP
ncbi:MAG TPA: hypothetical protein VI837_06220, partial [Blastocatellia bacterium]|nr:hypothetical protein [Blastocatellia bacterium]